MIHTYLPTYLRKLSGGSPQPPINTGLISDHEIGTDTYYLLSSYVQYLS